MSERTKIGRRARRYGKWAGNPSGRPEDTSRCAESVWDAYSPGGRQCARKRGHGRSKLYCRQHAKLVAP